LSTICQIFIINIMRVQVREQVKALLALRGLKLKDLPALLKQKTGKDYTEASLIGKLKRGSLSYNEMLVICEILNYEIEFKSLI